jgi:hypothetical protein
LQQDRKRGQTQADEPRADFGGGPEEDFRLVVGGVGVVEEFKADNDADGREDRGAGGYSVRIKIGGWESRDGGGRRRSIHRADGKNHNDQ